MKIRLELAEKIGSLKIQDGHHGSKMDAKMAANRYKSDLPLFKILAP